ncbi:hypothetical protein PoB_000335500 [Plakobranchus ocellatus]|uniref:Uncharacterized protein n=1 Tax=Plakobranchus ocellatus TaxID=259542 RepID=A0AAV3Y196_9GAST|nr:hypothetical protein PoB_000335500 [Plakobranchus ocellatus]
MKKSVTGLSDVRVNVLAHFVGVGLNLYDGGARLTGSKLSGEHLEPSIRKVVAYTVSIMISREQTKEMPADNQHKSSTGTWSSPAGPIKSLGLCERRAYEIVREGGEEVGT